MRHVLPSNGLRVAAGRFFAGTVTAVAVAAVVVMLAQPAASQPAPGATASASSAQIPVLIQPDSFGRARVTLQPGAAAAVPTTGPAALRSARAAASGSDGAATAAVRTTLARAQVEAKQQRLQAQRGLVPVFEKRELVGMRPARIDVAALDAGQPADYDPAEPIDPSLFETALLVRAKDVVDDERTRNGGRWSFQYLMTEMANTPVTGVAPEDFTLEWLRTWEASSANQTVNGWPVQPRPAVKAKVTDPWLAASGGQKLDLSKSPFKLL